jgi:methyl-accepting chemotaxis protein
MLLGRISVTSKLLLLFALLAVGVGAMAYKSLVSLNFVRVGGPAYEDVIRGKDLIADILPPPAYIIEAQLNAHELPDVTDAAQRDARIATLGQLEKDYEARLAHWQADLPEGEMKKTLTVDSAEPARKFFTVVRERLVPVIQRGDRKTAAEIVENELSPLYAQHRAAIDRTVTLATTYASDQEANGLAASKSARNTIIVAALLILGTACALGVLIAHNIAGPLRGLTKGIREVVEGNVVRDFHVDPRRRDEIGQIARAFDDFLGYVFSVIKEVQRASQTLSDASGRITEASHKVASDMDGQHETVQKMRHSVGALNTSFNTVAAQTEEVAAASQESGKIAEQLSKRGGEIRKIGELSAGLARQTNLLALNAAVEAARAGDHGQGFAVVAAEVRQLAIKSAEAASQITTLLDEIIGSTHDVTDEDRATLGAIARATTEVARQVTHIADATQQQTEAASVVNAGISGLATVTESTRTGTQQIAQEVVALTEQSRAMLSLTGKFKIERREHKRTDAEGRVDMSTPSGQLIQGSLLDHSFGGFGTVAPIAPELGERVRVVLPHEISPTPRTAVPVNSRPAKDGQGVRVGLKFVDR